MRQGCSHFFPQGARSIREAAALVQEKKANNHFTSTITQALRRLTKSMTPTIPRRRRGLFEGKLFELNPAGIPCPGTATPPS